MRIGIDTHFITSPAAGNRTYTAELVRALVALDQKNEYTLYAVADHPYYQQFADNPRVRVRRIASPNGWARYFVSLPRAMNQDSLDAVHLHMLPPWVNAPCLLAVHDLYYLHLSHPTFYERIVNGLVMWSVPRSEHVVTLSEYSKQDIVKHCSIAPEQVTVIPLAAGPGFVPIRDRSIMATVLQRYGIQRDYILFVGRTDDPRKNLITLLEAFAALKAAGAITEQLVIAGSHGPRTKAVQERIQELSLQADVILPGIVADADLPALFSGAKLFVYISSFEGFGLPVLEAMACGTPVITSNVTSLPEIVSDAAIMVVPGDVGELVDALRYVLNDSVVRAQLSDCGIARARYFSWERTAYETLKVYEQIFAAKRG